MLRTSDRIACQLCRAAQAVAEQKYGLRQVQSASLERGSFIPPDTERDRVEEDLEPGHYAGFAAGRE